MCRCSAFGGYHIQDTSGRMSEHCKPLGQTCKVYNVPISVPSCPQAVEHVMEQLREVEIAAMAKVWAYPEDLPLISQVGSHAQLSAA